MNKVLRIIKKIKLRNLIILILLLSFSSYAWMIFVTKVSTGISAHVTSWNFDFVLGDAETTTEIVFDVEQIYPGMQDYVKEIRVRNNGEMAGKLSYEVKKIVILGTPYVVSETLTSEQLLQKMETEFPFHLQLAVDGETDNVIPAKGTKNVKFSLVWPYDSGNDELDTEWGENAYDYYKNNPGGYCVHIELILKVTQIQG